MQTLGDGELALAPWNRQVEILPRLLNTYPPIVTILELLRSWATRACYLRQRTGLVGHGAGSTPNFERDFVRAAATFLERATCGPICRTRREWWVRIFHLQSWGDGRVTDQAKTRLTATERSLWRTIWTSPLASAYRSHGEYAPSKCWARRGGVEGW